MRHRKIQLSSKKYNSAFLALCRVGGRGSFYNHFPPFFLFLKLLISISTNPRLAPPPPTLPSNPVSPPPSPIEPRIYPNPDLNSVHVAVFGGVSEHEYHPVLHQRGCVSSTVDFPAQLPETPKILICQYQLK